MRLFFDILQLGKARGQSGEWGVQGEKSDGAGRGRHRFALARHEGGASAQWGRERSGFLPSSVKSVPSMVPF
jgi:hypothetical protein